MVDGAPSNDIAIVGMSLHVPGSSGLEAYWDNLRAGRGAIRRLSRDELVANGEAPHLTLRPDYVPYAAPLERFAEFDAEFFGFSPKDAAVMDPQHRLFLETAWEALEVAGHPPEGLDGRVGVWAGCGMGSYFYFNLCSNPDLLAESGMFLLRHTGNDKDFLSTRLSHLLDLTGPSVNVQTACSTSLVATHYAAQALLTGECDVALAGGVTIELPQGRGYLYRQGEVLSPDGACHAFDHRAQGTVFGSGVAVAVLRRLEDARADGDHIWAVIKGSAVNNDGAGKAGYMAPSVGGQAAAVAEAQAMAGVDAGSIGYVECHGTGTYLGDPIEVAALTEAFRKTTAEVGFCKLGSVKTNIGHLDTAAGGAGLIKAALALHHRQIPPSLGYEAPNPAIGFDGSPFTVASSLTDWPAGPTPRRAGVNALGVGGTNAHVVLEEASPLPAAEASPWPFQPLVISARSKAALDAAGSNLAAWLRDNPGADLADVAFTLKEGRRAFERRRVVVAESAEEAAALIEAGDPRRVFTHSRIAERVAPTFMFPGGGAQYAGMARDLYETEPVFADWMDRGLALLEPKLDYDIRALWLPEPGAEAAAEMRLRTPSVQLPLILIAEVALARLWMSWGVQPTALIGHSMGENTAACLAGVMSLADAIGLVHLRGCLMDGVPAGGMLSVALPAAELAPLLGAELDLAVINGPGLSVASGPVAALERLDAELQHRGIEAQGIGIDIAAHSRMLDPVLAEFGAFLRSIALSPPQIPLISNRSGTWLTDAEAVSPEYWVNHLRGTVDFEGGLSTLATDPARLYIEVGPGKALASLAGQHGAISANQVTGTLRHARDDVADDACFMAMLARVWAMGGEIDWAQIWGGARRRRLVLPTYPFQRQTWFIAPGKAAQTEAPWLMRSDEVADWGWEPAWRPEYAACETDVAEGLATFPPSRFLFFADEAGLAAALAQRLRGAGHAVRLVRAGDAFAALENGDFILAPEGGRDGYDQLIRALIDADAVPDRIAHVWLTTADERFRPGSSFFHRLAEQGFWSLLHLAQAMAGEGLEEAHLLTVTNGAQSVRGEPVLWPAKALAEGPARVMPREFPGLTSAMLDLTLPPLRKGKPLPQELQDAVLEELLATPASTVAALRGARRYRLGWREAQFPEAETLPLEAGAAVLFTGGFGGISLILAKALATRPGARIALVSRTALPPRAEWPAWQRSAAAGDRLASRMRAVQELEEAGAEVLLIAADVSNLEDMRAARAVAEARFGRLSAVVHAAGVIDDAPMLAKSPLSIEEVFTPKVHGTEVLAEVFADGTLDLMVLFSSSSTATTPAGQVDYVAANAFLSASARSAAWAKTRILALGWGIWSEVGMAAEAMAARTGAAEDQAEATGLPLLPRKQVDAQGNRRFTAEWQTSGEWVLGEHRTRAGDALLPGTGYLELAAEALAGQGEDRPFEVQGLTFLAPLRAADSGPTRLRLTLPRSDAGYGFTVESAAEGAGFTLNAEAEISLLPLAEPPPLDIAAIEARLGPAQHRAPVGGALEAAQAGQLRFGPRWQVLVETRLGEAEGLARLRLPLGARGDSAYALHPGLLDIATGWAIALAPAWEPGHLWVPMAYGSVRVFGPLPTELVSHVRLENAGDGHASFAITLAAPDGAVAMEVRGFDMRRLEGGLRFAAAAAPEPAAGPRPLSPAEERLRHNLSQGIRPQEGAEAFFRALATGRRQLIVSSLPLPGLIEEAGRSERQTEGQSFERPQLDSDFAPPETEVEKRLAGFWRELLGLDEVGIDDSFFDLGGHSLVAVRLFAQVKKALGVDFPISLLFEAPTIRKIAAAVTAKGGLASAAADGTAPAPARAQKRFTHLVPMHQGEGGSRAPFFIVSGMFGNVLNLRHLAHLIGTDRPFYGLQAKGLLGGEAPHARIEEAAAAMIAEIRAVRPRGPYMLGGFSGGGITAYEIARQLTASGEEVGALILLDTPLPQRRPLTRPDRAAIQWQELRSGGLAYPFRWAARRVAWEIEKRRPGEATEAPASFHNTRIEAAFLQAVAAYRLQPWQGPFTLFRPPLRGKWQVAPGRWVSDERAYVTGDNDWTAHAPRIETFEVPGSHDSMVLEPNVRVLAARMRKVIEAAERPARPARAPWPKEEAAE